MARPERPWAQLLERYTKDEAHYHSTIPPGASQDQVNALLADAKSHGLNVPEAYIDFLRARNGTSFNGLMLYGAGIPRDDPFKRNDLVVMNYFHWNRGEATVLGTRDIDVYVSLGPHGPYCRLDSGCWDVIDQFDSCDELLVSIFEAEIESLEPEIPPTLASQRDNERET